MINNNRDFARAKKIEEDVAWFIGYNLGRTVINMPDEFSPFDYIMAKEAGGIRIATAVAEFRHRPSTRMSQYKTFNINKSKIDSLREWGEKLKIPPIMLVLWEDTGVMWCKIRRSYPIKHDQVRNHQDRPNDRPEDQYEIPLDSFGLLMDYEVRN